MESLRLRPLLLSYIADFVGRDNRPCVNFHNSFAVYHRLVDRWLVNRTSDFQYRFAHATMLEFLLAFAILNKQPGFDVRGLRLSRVAFRFLMDGPLLEGKRTVDLRGAVLGFADVGIEFARVTWGIELVPIPSGEFLMGSPEDEVGRFPETTSDRPNLLDEIDTVLAGHYGFTAEELDLIC